MCLLIFAVITYHQFGFLLILLFSGSFPAEAFVLFHFIKRQGCVVLAQGYTNQHPR